MRFSELVKVDSKGRVTIPLVIREALNIVEGMNLILVADPDKKEIILTPLPATKGLLAEIRIELKDVPGALAQTAERLASLGIDQVSSQCTTVKRGEYAECIIIVDMSQTSKTVKELEEELSNLPVTRLVRVRELQR